METLVNIDQVPDPALDVLELGTDYSSLERASSVTSNTSSCSVESNEQDVIHSSNSSSAHDIDTRLCGFLNKNKSTARTVGKLFKRRWFVFCEASCKLRYYRTPSDTISLGKIDISQATFTFDVEQFMGRPHVFQISSQGNIYYLEAADKQTMMYWLQQLQHYRHKHNSKDVDLFGDLTTGYQTSSGLIANNLDREMAPPVDSIDEVMDHVNQPVHSVGLSSARKASSEGSNLANLSFSHLKVELKNAMSSRKNRKSLTSDDSIEGRSPRPSKFSEFKRLLSKSTSVELGKVLSTHESKSGERGTDFYRIGRSTMYDLEEAETSNEQKIDELHREVENLKVFIKTHHCSCGGDKLITSKDRSLSPDLISLSDSSDYLIDFDVIPKTSPRSVDHDKSARMSADIERHSMLEQIDALRETIQHKDEIVYGLATKLTELENKISTEQSCNQPISDQERMENYRDTVHAYETQNKFLNKEILQLQTLRLKDEEKMRQMYINYKMIEGKYFQIQSKYLVCLEQMSKPQQDGSSTTIHDEWVAQLIQDAMNTNVSDQCEITPTNSYSKPTYDRYGFLEDQLTKEQDILNYANKLKRRSAALVTEKDLQDNISHGVQWENFLHADGASQRSHEFKLLVRTGIPDNHRENVWNRIVEFYVKDRRQKMGADYYELLQENCANKFNPAAKQIELDLLRTLPHNVYYDKLTSDGIPKLRRILLAYTRHNPDIGYCQGLNRLVAIALLFLSELDAFWCLVAIVEHILPPEYFTKTLAAAQVDQRVLKEIVSVKLPHLSAHLIAMNVDLSLFTFNWFLTVFVDNFPVKFYLRIWDAFLYEGSKVLFRFALACLQTGEDELLEMTETLDINTYLRSIGDNMTDINETVKIAFEHMNPFSMKNINTKRQAHSIAVHKELAEFEDIRRQYRCKNSILRDVETDLTSSQGFV